MEQDITPWSNAEFTTLEMARHSRLIPLTNINSLKNIIKKQLMMTPSLQQNHLLGRRLIKVTNPPVISLTPIKQLATDGHVLHRSIEITRDKSVKLKRRGKVSLSHEVSGSRLAKQIYNSEVLERREIQTIGSPNDNATQVHATLQPRKVKVVMPQILSKSPKEIRNPQNHNEQEAIFLPFSRLNRQKRQDSLVLPKVKLSLPSQNLHTIDAN